jgi:adenylate cyclase
MRAGTQRKLAAVLVADVVGYSALMGEDEDGTLAALRGLRQELFAPSVSRHRGEVIKRMGDGWLVAFDSAVDAVGCATEVQDGLSDNEKIKLCIGLHVGDIVHEDEDIFGDGVNIAARLQEVAAPGAVVISDVARRSVDGKLAAEFVDLGLQRLKNIAEPIAAYGRGMAAGQGLPVQLSLPDKPSIVVLPFENRSGDEEQEYFSEGISEDLATALSRFDWLFVIARNSAFSFKGNKVDVGQVGRELGVRYVLEGSVRRAGDRVRINAQLIEAAGERQVWSERYDRRMDDVFELQDEIVASIAATVGPEITNAEIDRSRGKRPETLDAWDCYLQALAAYNKMTEEGVMLALGHLEEAIRIEPDFAGAFALRALCQVQIGVYGWIRPVRQAFVEARQAADQAIRLAPTLPESNQALAFVLMATGAAEEAVTAAQRAIELNPNYAEAYATLGHALILCGRFDEGLEACTRAVRCSPRDLRGTWLYDGFGHAYFMLGEYEKSIEVSKKGRQQDPSLIGALLNLAGSCAELGRQEEAKGYVDELLTLVPRYSLTALRKNPMFVKQELVDNLVDSMRRAGLPE